MIPPLLAIEYQMETICKKWMVPFCNISGLSAAEIIPSLISSQAKVVLSSIETISDLNVQKAILNLKVNYIAIDECQVGCPINFRR